MEILGKLGEDQEKNGETLENLKNNEENSRKTLETWEKNMGKRVGKRWKHLGENPWNNFGRRIVQ